MYCKSASFYIKQKNLDYIDDQIKDKDRYNKSNWLDDLIDHLRSKAKPVTKEKKKATVKRFVPPTQDEVFFYFKEKGLTSDDQAQKFCDYYKSNGWKVGKNKMKDWMAAANNWLKAEWLDHKTNTNGMEITNQNVMDKIKKGNITHISQIPSPVRSELETQMRIGGIKKETALQALNAIGFGL